MIKYTKSNYDRLKYKFNRSNEINENESQAYQDMFILSMLDGKENGVFIEIGWIPSIDFDQITKKNKLNEIIVDKQCRTNISGVFAAGDITDIGIWQIIVAAGEGAKAAITASEYLAKQK